MKKIHFLLFMLWGWFLTGCMDNHEYPVDYAPGNASIGKSNTTIDELKEKFQDVTSANGIQQIEEDIIISGVVVGDDESGNIYKSLYIHDGTGTMQIGINASGLYAQYPVGQTIVVNCKGLYIGGYGTMAQLGGYYQGKIGRMQEMIWNEHVRPEGRPVTENPIVKRPLVLDEAGLKALDKSKAPYYVRLNDVFISEANGISIYAPEDEADGGNGVNRNLMVGKTKLAFRNSTYANYSTEIMPTGSIDITGLLTIYNGTWQLAVRTARDIETNETN